MNKGKLFWCLMALIAVLAFSSVSWAYAEHPTCHNSSNYSTVAACCPDVNSSGCEGTTFYSGCYVTEDLYPLYGFYSCQCFLRPDFADCIAPPDPTFDLYIYDKSLPSLAINQSFCMDLQVKNRGTTCYTITSSKVFNSDVSVNWTTQSDSHDYTLCENDTEWITGFCGTPTTSGSLNIELRLTINSNYYYVDDFNTTVSPSSCTNECVSGEVGCNGSGQTYTCIQSNGCWVKSYSNCASGTSCLNGSCVPGCTNECNMSEYRCLSSAEPQWCQYNSSTGCWFWETYTTCGTGYECVAGLCQQACDPECTYDGQFICTTQTGGKYCMWRFDNACLVSGNFGCNNGYVCSDGNCLSTNCTDDCTAGSGSCESSNAKWNCGENNDGDVCLEKVITICPDGQWCDNGTCGPVAAPSVTISATSVATGVAYTVSWNNVANSYGYEIQEATNNSFTGAFGWSYGTTSKSFSHTVTVATTYYYRVRSQDSQGVYSVWSNIVSVTVLPSCTSNCASGDIGCSSSTVRYECQQVQTGCWQKVDVQSCGLGCSAGKCLTCLDECTLYTAGCSSSTQKWTCGEALDGDNCLDKVYSNCGANQECVSDQCLDINYLPVFSNPAFDASTSVFTVTVSDANGDNLRWVNIYIWKSDYTFVGVYSMSVLSGSNSKTGIVYSVNLSSFPNGNYLYLLIASDGKAQGDSQTMQPITICRTNFQCGDWSNCYFATGQAPPGYHIYDWIQKRACVDQNGCVADPQYEWKPCDCNYTSFQWVGDSYPLEIGDGGQAVFKLTWEGGCSGDVLSVQKQIGDPPFCFCSSDIWDNKDEPFSLTVNESGTMANEEYFGVNLAYAAADYRLFLGRYTQPSSLYTPIMPTSNHMKVSPFYHSADPDDLARYIRLAQLPLTCNSDVTLSDECNRYWQEMGISFESQLIQSLSTYDLIWMGTCFGCAAAAYSEPMLILTWAGGPVPGTASTALVVAGGLACDFCIQVPVVTINPANAAAVSKVILGNRAVSRITDLGELASEASHLPVTNGAYIRYVDDTGKLITEAYGLSSLGTDSLLFNTKVRNIPMDFLQNYDVIDVHLNVVPLNLESFHQMTLGFSAEVAENYWKALGNMFDDGLYKLEATHAWDLAHGGKLGPISDYVHEVIPTTGVKYATASYAPYYHKWVINFNLVDDVLPSQIGGFIPQWEAAVYGMLPHEYFHVANFELIERFSNPKGVTYVLNSIPEGTEVTNRWFAEFYAHTIYIDLIQGDPIRYQKYIDSIYGLIHSSNGGVEKWIADAVQYSRSESTMMFAQKNYQLLKAVDPSAAQQILNQVDNADAFLLRNVEIEDDVYWLHADMVEKPGFVATENMDSLLLKYKLVKPPVVPSAPSHSSGGGGSGSSIFGCAVSDSNNSSPLNLLVLLAPVIIVLFMRKYWRPNRT